MNGKSNSDRKQGAGSTGGSSRKGALIMAALGIGGLIIAIAVFNSGSPQAPAGSNSAKPDSSGSTASAPQADSTATAKPAFGVVVPGSESQNSSPAPKAVVSDIVRVATLTNEVSAEDAQKFKDGLTELVRQGPASVPAIQDYLDKNTDSNYGEVKGAEQLGYSSLRHALLDTLKQIPGPESEGSMVHVLQTTAEPNEIGELARDLEQKAPGQYRDQILQAAREALDMAQNGQFGTNFERGALYRVFQTLGASYSPPGAQAAGQGSTTQ